MGSSREAYLKYIPSGNLRIAFYQAVMEGWGEEIVNAILDEKNRRATNGLSVDWCAMDEAHRIGPEYI
jgi:hypothetical protein